MGSGNLKPGDLHVFNKGVVLGMGVWAAKSESGQIHIHITGGERFHTTVSNQKKSKRYHRTIFRNLRRTLIANGKWPYGDEGSETELGHGVTEGDELDD